MNTTYTTRNKAIECEIISAIEAGEATLEEFDIDAIADEVLGDYHEGFALQVDTDTFWEIVAKNVL